MRLLIIKEEGAIIAISKKYEMVFGDGMADHEAKIKIL